MEKTIKTIIIFFIIIIGINIIFINKSNADIDPGNYEPNTVTQTEAYPLVNKVGVVLGALRNVSIIVSVIMIMCLGVKYILGSVEEKAEYKESMKPLIIGAILASSGTTIVSFIYNSVK